MITLLSLCFMIFLFGVIFKILRVVLGFYFALFMLFLQIALCFVAFPFIGMMFFLGDFLVVLGIVGIVKLIKWLIP